MTRNINLKHLLMLLAVLFASVTMTSCLNGETETPEERLSTGLCNCTWQLVQLTSEASEYYTIDPNDIYVFDASGKGFHNYTNSETGEVETMKFTWESYTYSGATHRLDIKYEKYGNTTFNTIYTINTITSATDNTIKRQLVLAINDENGNPCVGYYEAR